MILIIGDPQQTTWLEKKMGREDNELGRQLLFKSLTETCTNQKVEAVFFLGDSVAVGSSSSDWLYFDQLVREVSVPVYGIMGNHDYYGLTSTCIKKAASRFRNLSPSQTWSLVRVGSWAFICLDSNFSRLSKSQRAAQIDWLQSTQELLNQDSHVDGIFYLSHHPPYTESTHLKPSQMVREQFASSFKVHPKNKIFFSGHIHGYETFEMDKKLYVISAGGGGPRLETHKKPLHFLAISSAPHGIELRALGLTENSILEFDQKTL